MDRMLKASRNNLARQGDWIKERRASISSSLAKLDSDFDKLVGGR
jgi:argininosuccinate lyase